MTDASRPPFWSSLAKMAIAEVVGIAHLIAIACTRPFSRDRAWRVFTHWGRSNCRLFGVTIASRDENAGKTIEGPRLYIGLNQSSFVDLPAFTQVIPPYHTAIAVEHALFSLTGLGIVLLGSPIIVRQWKGQAKRAIDRATASLAAGNTWTMSIEGARSRDGKILPFKKGPVVMALRAQATIIPVVMHGARDVMPRGEWRIGPGNIEVHLLKAIPTRGLTYEDRDKVLEQLRAAAEQDLLERAP